MVSADSSLSAVCLDRSLFVKGELQATDLLKFVKDWKCIDILQTCRVVKPNVFELTFKDKSSVDEFERLGSTFVISGTSVEQFPADSRRKKVFIHGLPGSFDDRILRIYMEQFCQVLALDREVYDSEFSGVDTGVRVALVATKNDIPPFLRIGDHAARLSYAGLKSACWECGDVGHHAIKCPSPRCRNCLETTHLVSACPTPCRICLTHHDSSICEKEVFFKTLLSIQEGNVSPPHSPILKTPSISPSKSPIVTKKPKKKKFKQTSPTRMSQRLKDKAIATSPAAVSTSAQPPSTSCSHNVELDYVPTLIAPVSARSPSDFSEAALLENLDSARKRVHFANPKSYTRMGYNFFLEELHQLRSPFVTPNVPPDRKLSPSC